MTHVKPCNQFIESLSKYIFVKAMFQVASIYLFCGMFLYVHKGGLKPDSFHFFMVCFVPN